MNIVRTLARTAQKVAFFLASQFLYLIIGVPLIGARSYCTHLCPMGLEVTWFVHARATLSRLARRRATSALDRPS